LINNIGINSKFGNQTTSVMPTNEIIRESSIENPLGFFEHFFLRGGFYQLHRGFFIFFYEDGESEGEPIFNEPIIEVNKEEEYYVYEDSNNDEGIVYQRKSYFKDVLKSHLLSEASITKKLINERIKTLKLKEKKVVFFLKDITSSLNNLSINIKSNPKQSKYLINNEIIYYIVESILNRYNLFFSKIDSPFIQEASEYFLNKKVLLEKRKETKTTENLGQKSQNSQRSINGFSWNCRPESKDLNTLLLYGILSNNKVIQDDDITLYNFRLAFSGSKIDTPLRIKWFLAKNGKYPKPVLIRVIKQILMDELKILKKMDNGELAKALSMIFVDSEGTAFKNMIVTLSQEVSEKTELIETALINELKSAPFLPNPDNIS